MRSLNYRAFLKQLKSLQADAVNVYRHDDQLELESMLLRHEQLSVEIEKAFLRNRMSDTHYLILGQRVKDAVASLERGSSVVRPVREVSTDTLSLGVRLVPAADGSVDVEPLKEVPAWAQAPLVDRQPLDLSALGVTSEELDLMGLITSDVGQDLARRWVEQEPVELPPEGLVTSIPIQLTPDPELPSATKRGATGDPLTTPSRISETGIQLAVEEQGASRTGQDLRGVVFRFALLSDVDFSEADLRNARFEHSSLHGSGFRDARLEGAAFIGCNLSRCDFTGADAELASFSKCELDPAWSHLQSGAAPPTSAVPAHDAGAADEPDAAAAGGPSAAAPEADAEAVDADGVPLMPRDAPVEAEAVDADGVPLVPRDAPVLAPEDEASIDDLMEQDWEGGDDEHRPRTPRIDHRADEGSD